MYPALRPQRAGGRRPASGNGVDRLRRVQVALGLCWILDGALQCQPSMFRRGFVTSVLLPTARGNPAPVADPIIAVAHFLEPHIAVWNALFAAVQLGIGAGLLLRATVRPALAVSFVWALAVWWLGEGLGGLLTGTASPLTGAPGAALLYIFVGVGAWPRSEHASSRPASGDASGTVSPAISGVGRGARVAWAALWVGSAALLLQSANLADRALGRTLAAAGVGQPAWYTSLLSGAARAIGDHGTGFTVAVAAEMALVGIGIALGWKTQSLLGVATVLALAVWVFGEGLGGILTGTGTDPNTGPLLVLAALALYRPDGARALANTSQGAVLARRTVLARRAVLAPGAVGE